MSIVIRVRLVTTKPPSITTAAKCCSAVAASARMSATAGLFSHRGTRDTPTGAAKSLKSSPSSIKFFSKLAFLIDFELLSKVIEIDFSTNILDHPFAKFLY